MFCNFLEFKRFYITFSKCIVYTLIGSYWLLTIDSCILHVYSYAYKPTQNKRKSVENSITKWG